MREFMVYAQCSRRSMSGREVRAGEEKRDGGKFYEEIFYIVTVGFVRGLFFFEN